MSKRESRKLLVHDALLMGPATLGELVAHTKLTAAAVSLALRDIRNDPAIGYATIATKSGDYKYRIAATPGDMLPGLVNAAKHWQTRAESFKVAGHEMGKVAATPADYILAADITVRAEVMATQAEAILSALK